MSDEQKAKNNTRQRLYYATIGGRAAILASAYRKIDKRKGITSDITSDFLLEHIVCKPCVYCGDTEEIGCDRIDNSKGHTKDNVVPCCRTCNITRMDNFSHEEMLILGETIKQIKANRTTCKEAA